MPERRHFHVGVNDHYTVLRTHSASCVKKKNLMNFKGFRRTFKSFFSFRLTILQIFQLITKESWYGKEFQENQRKLIESWKTANLKNPEESPRNLERFSLISFNSLKIISNFKKWKSLGRIKEWVVLGEPRRNSNHPSNISIISKNQKWIVKLWSRSSKVAPKNLENI